MKNQRPRDSATIVVLRDGASGLEVLLARRASRSRVLADTYVFPGGKLERSDQLPETLGKLDEPAEDLLAQIGEPDLTPEQAAALYVTAIREAAEESGLLFFKTADPLTETRRGRICSRLRSGDPLAAVLNDAAAHLAASALVPWSRWITPRDAPIINRRFDTRFFLAASPQGQGAHADAYEINEMHWFTPQAALERYQNHEMALIPPQIVSLMHLLHYSSVGAALRDARLRRPPLIEPEILRAGESTVMCYPGDPAHPVSRPGFPAWVPTRLIVSGHYFAPPQGYAPFLHHEQQRSAAA